ncbi:MAG: hypothetical protein H7Z14_12460 [Anaerolineae bacterium]|nr:hypothetical protein [Phycisphaerae bacterium]
MASHTRLIVALGLSLAFTASTAIAQVSLSLPSNGSYEPGQFMPVIVNAEVAARGGTITLAAPGALSTTIAMHGRSQVTVPMLMLTGEAGRMSWSLNGPPPRETNLPLAPDARDGLLDQTATGLRSAIGGADCYAPTLSWHPGSSVRVRRMSILTATLVAILLLASTLLLRGRRAIVAVCSVVALSAGAIEIGRRYVSPIWRAEGQIVVVGSEKTAQFDTWQYITTRSTAETSIELPKGARPVFVDSQHARDVQASLHFDAARNILSLRCRLEPQMKVAVLLRRITESAPAPPSTQPIARALKSPMSELARRAYVTRETCIVDEGSVQWIDDQLVHWPSVILWREER